MPQHQVQTTTNTQVPNLTQQQEQVLGPALQTGQETLENFETFQGPTVAGFNPNQITAQNQTLQAGQAAVGGVNAALRALEFGLGDALFPSSNPALQDAIDNAILPQTRTFAQNVLPGIAQGAIQAGQPGSSRHGVAEGIASQALLQGVQNTGENLSFRGYEAGLDLLGKSLALAPQTIGALGIPAQFTAAVGDQQQNMQQQQMNAERNRFYEDQLLPLSVANNAASLALGLPSGSTSTATTPTGVQGAGGFNSTLGAASTGAAIGALINPIFGPWIGAGLGAIGKIFFD